ncbi:MAG: PEP/pyruvate-binding domain-containing protein [Humidesulfovibrio sp.]|uniref:PEP/pyruvate-binding domain-containing protein n=1 Tax=Humidesulfovibrio sp. TaxID=2910988 RepID=UPI0027334119|nr:PEP/pyruvate-binding domain-containing protein [Humidesulfovibrio sp.]MDP2849423.1 PEP/pyruvate-binding domain-containing protein [Humidesulfovibrio sp.]
MLKFLNMLLGSGKQQGQSRDDDAVKRKYEYFKSLLIKNNRSLEILTELEHLLFENKPFTLDHVLALSEDLISLVYDLAEDLNALSGGKYPGLFDATERLGVTVLKDLVHRKRIKKGELLLPMRALSAELADEVGGKAANLGEVGNRAGLPTPRGFAVSAYACQHFLKTTGLSERIERRMKRIDVKDTEKLMEICEEIQAMIMAAPLPEELSRGMARLMEELAELFGPEVRVSVRSSATCEDSEATFAGQHSTVLNVSAQNVDRAWKEVVASTFSPRAVYYRRSMGYSDDDVVMAVLCVTMIDARASGVMYTCDPNGPGGPRREGDDDILISAAWGLGVSVVDGSASTDFYAVRRKDSALVRHDVAKKIHRLRLRTEDGIREEAVPEAERETPCLDEAKIRQLAAYGVRLEEHYGQPLDIEWAQDQSGRLFILQARPLGIGHGAADECSLTPEAEPLHGREVALRGGDMAAPGSAAGPAYILTTDHNLPAVPQGAILVARQTSPTYVPVMDRIRGIITEVGSVTGHMASVAREFGVPTLVGLDNATLAIEQGEDITLDATSRIVYRGIVPELIRDKPCVNLMKGSPVYKAAQEALKRMAPLTLTDPKADNFSPEGCRSLHDVIRFAHEMGMREMFNLGDEMEDTEGAVRLRAGLPLNILVVDLGGGLTPTAPKKVVELEHIKSAPFQGLLHGMTDPGVRWLGGVGVSLTGFATIMAESIMSDPNADGSLGGPSYAVVSDHYLNFNTRLGYHFAVVDSYCGPSINDNYIVFSFKGGAADIARRSRRAKLIAQILKRLAFKTEIKGDMVRGEIKKYSQTDLKQKLDMVGRLLGAVRLLDMLLSDDGQIGWYVDEFFKGNYAFERHGDEPQPPPQQDSLV